MYIKEDFNKCSFNPMEEGSMIKVYPKLGGIIDLKWLTDHNIEKIIRYVIMVFDPKSPLNAVTNLKERKIIAFELTGIDKLNKETNRQILENSYGDILPTLIVEYLKCFPRSRDWAILCILENKFWETVDILMKPLEEVGEKKGLLKSSEDKTKIVENIKKDQSDIDYYYKMIFGEDEEIEKVAKRTSISPQSIANLSNK